jgi:hypothetical protein
MPLGYKSRYVRGRDEKEIPISVCESSTNALFAADCAVIVALLANIHHRMECHVQLLVTCLASAIVNYDPASQSLQKGELPAILRQHHPAVGVYYLVATDDLPEKVRAPSSGSSTLSSQDDNHTFPRGDSWRLIAIKSAWMPNFRRIRVVW